MIIVHVVTWKMLNISRFVLFSFSLEGVRSRVFFFILNFWQNLTKKLAKLLEYTLGKNIYLPKCSQFTSEKIVKFRQKKKQLVSTDEVIQGVFCQCFAIGQEPLVIFSTLLVIFPFFYFSTCGNFGMGKHFFYLLYFILFYFIFLIFSFW